MSRRKFWGWGLEGQGPSPEQAAGVARTLGERFGAELVPEPAPRIEDVALRAPRVRPPDALAHLCTDDPAERAGHSYGKSYRDVVRAFRREFPNPPDQVALPRTENDVEALLEWCGEAGIAAIPYGGGSSVVGGVEPDVGDGYAGAVSVDLRHLDRVLEIDRASRSARIQGGVLAQEWLSVPRQPRSVPELPEGHLSGQSPEGTGRALDSDLVEVPV